MTTRTTHDTFTIERTFNAPPARVFQALADAEQKAKWFAGPPGWKLVERHFDFRVGGLERVSGTHASGMSSIFDARYHDIVPDKRVVYSYEMTVNGARISVSLATFELVAAGENKTKLVLTEQGVYFEDESTMKYMTEGAAASRLKGTQGLMDQFQALFAS